YRNEVLRALCGLSPFDAPLNSPPPPGCLCPAASANVVPPPNPLVPPRKNRLLPGWLFPPLATHAYRAHIILKPQFADLCVQRLHVDGWLRRSVADASTKNIGSPALERRFPRCDLIGVDVELLRQLSQGSVALDGVERHFP